MHEHYPKACTIERQERRMGQNVLKERCEKTTVYYEQVLNKMIDENNVKRNFVMSKIQMK